MSSTDNNFERADGVGWRRIIQLLSFGLNKRKQRPACGLSNLPTVRSYKNNNADFLLLPKSLSSYRFNSNINTHQLQESKTQCVKTHTTPKPKYRSCQTVQNNSTTQTENILFLPLLFLDLFK